MAYLPDSENDFREAIADAVRDAVLELIPAAVRKATRKQYLTKRELMELTGWSSRTVDYRKATNAIPYIQRGRKILFPTDELDAYFCEGYVPARR